jgi:lipid A disaccharide synthetase
MYNEVCPLQTENDHLHHEVTAEATLSMVQSGTDQTEVRTGPNPQVLGLVLCEGGPDPHLQV